jgi:tetratricopeptide (TPR) repeat protein
MTPPPQLETLPLPPAPAPSAGQWTPFPYPDLPRLDASDLPARWARLHAGQGVPTPGQGALAEGWALYHSGDFERAAALALAQGPAGATLAYQATAVYANYLEPRESVRLGLFKQVAERATEQIAAEPENWEALYWQAYALGRYSQGISVARALAQGLGSRVKGALESVIALQPQHADAHVALGTFHAEVIDKVGPLVARMTYGARAETSIAQFERGLQIHPNAPGAMMEYARGLLMLRGESHLAEATRLYERAARHQPADARERLEVELARAGLKD